VDYGRSNSASHWHSPTKRKGLALIRPHLLDMLGHVVHARMMADVLQAEIVRDMSEGFRPTFRGHEWNRDHFDALEGAVHALEVSWHLLKWLQFPEVQSRLQDALDEGQKLASLNLARKELPR
jgi:hypothetical protein